ILHARGAKGRGPAIGLFGVQFALNLIWTPLFFGMHRVEAALLVIVAMLVVAIATTVAFSRIRVAAAWLMVPYLVWISFAGVLT
ncbi:TspO/MBR family protein, partial [Clostridium perfringens]